LEGDLITSQLRKFGAHQRSDLAMLLSFVRQGDWVIDVGAHIGSFSVPLGQAVGPTGRVFAFEPVPENFELLCQNVAQSGLVDVVTPVNAVVTRSHSVLRMRRNPENTGDVSFWHSDGEEVSGVQQIGLDSWWQGCRNKDRRVDLIKIDVEGMEYDVLCSGEKLIASHKPLVVFEVRAGGSVAPYSDPLSLALAKMGDFLAYRGYDLFVNLHNRNCTEDVFELAPLERLTPSQLPRQLLDVLAVPKESNRHP
jgi:FkbM family methyltransferase